MCNSVRITLAELGILVPSVKPSLRVFDAQSDVRRTAALAALAQALDATLEHLSA